MQQPVEVGAAVDLFLRPESMLIQPDPSMPELNDWYLGRMIQSGVRRGPYMKWRQIAASTTASRLLRVSDRKSAGH